MWLAAQRGRWIKEEPAAEVGRVTLAGAPAGVRLEGERREVPVFAPGGYAWRPRLGQEVLVLKTGGEGEQPCIAGCWTDPEGLEDGEAALSGTGCRVLLSNDGEIRLTGTVTVNGETLEAMIGRIAASMLGGIG